MSTLSAQRQKIHPHKMLLWIAITSICMMFAGWTSAFMVRKAQGNWLFFSLPTAFWISTVVIIASSVTMHFSIREFKKRNMSSYKKLISLTALLGVAFMLLQFLGFYEMNKAGITLASNGDGVSGSFIHGITWAHIIHMMGGVIALVVVFFVVNFRKRTKVYTSNGLEILGTYWHFVDVLWIYLFLFFLYNQK